MIYSPFEGSVGTSNSSRKGAMHSDENTQPSNPTPEELTSQAHAHALEEALQTMEEFLDQEGKRFILEEEIITRTPHDAQEVGDETKSEMTHLILLVDPKRPTPVTVVYYEGLDSGEKGYGILSEASSHSSVEMMSFASPQHLLQVYGDDAVLAAARAINNRNDELRMRDAFDGTL